jgi:phosphomevalonate kinase
MRALQELAKRLSLCEAAHAATREALALATRQKDSVLLAYGRERRRLAELDGRSTLVDQGISSALQSLQGDGILPKMDTPSLIRVWQQHFYES